MLIRDIENCFSKQLDKIANINYQNELSLTNKRVLTKQGAFLVAKEDWYFIDCEFVFILTTDTVTKHS